MSTSRIQTAAALLALAVGTGLTLAMPSAPAIASMAKYKWKNRPLVVFAASAGSNQLTQQKALVNSRIGGFRDRDMVVIYVVGTTVQARLGSAPGLTAAQLRQRYGVSRGAFRAILVGKDGGRKLSASSPLTPRRLFNTIDAMPMRRQEMRGQ